MLTQYFENQYPSSWKLHPKVLCFWAKSNSRSLLSTSLNLNKHWVLAIYALEFEIQLVWHCITCLVKVMDQIICPSLWILLNNYSGTLKNAQFNTPDHKFSTPIQFVCLHFFLKGMNISSSSFYFRSKLSWNKYY